MADQAADASLFVSEFGDMMTGSTPHLYLSALPCAPNQSFISKQFTSQYPQLLNFDIGTQDGDWDNFGRGGDNTNKIELREIWLKSQHLLLLVSILGGVGNYFQILDITKKHRLRVRIGESHAGVRAVSPEDNHWSLAYVGSGGLCLWGIDSKEEFVLDKSGHNITKLTFSTTGNRLMGSDSRGNIKIWDVRTRRLVFVDKLSVSVEWVNAVAFSSVDSAFIVAYTTSNNKIVIQIQDCESRAVLKGPFESFTPIRSIVSTANDTRIVCRSALRLEILNTSTGKSQCFDTVEFNLSPNRKYAAWVPMGDKNKVKFWDLDRDTALDGPLLNYRVNRLDFSADSTRVSVLYGADKREGRISIWDIEAEHSVMRPFPCTMDCWPSFPHIALHGDSLFLASDGDLGKMWDLRVLEITSSLYDNHLNNSHSDMLPAHNLEVQRCVGCVMESSIPLDNY